jgi:hypothetical protein
VARDTALDEASLLCIFRYWAGVFGRAFAQTRKFGKAKLLTGAFLAAAAFIVQQRVFQLPTATKVLISVGIGYCALVVGSFVWYIIRTPSDLDSEKAGRISRLNDEVASFQFTPVQLESRRPLLERLTVIRARIEGFESKIPQPIADEDELATLPGKAKEIFETRSTEIIKDRAAAYNDFEDIVREINLSLEIGAGFSTEIARLRGEFSAARSVEINTGTPPRRLADRCQVVRTYINAFMDQLVVNRARITADYR